MISVVVFGIIHLSTNLTKWSNILKQFDGKLPTNCLSVFHHFVGLVRKGSKKGSNNLTLAASTLQSVLFVEMTCSVTIEQRF